MYPLGRRCVNCFHLHCGQMEEKERRWTHNFLCMSFLISCRVTWFPSFSWMWGEKSLSNAQSAINMHAMLWGYWRQGSWWLSSYVLALYKWDGLMGRMRGPAWSHPLEIEFSLCWMNWRIIWPTRQSPHKHNFQCQQKATQMSENVYATSHAQINAVSI